jgi:hypothetical protein
MVFDWSLIIPVLGGAGRNILGWLQNSLANGQIDSYEWKKLISTILEVAVLSISAMYGIGLDVTQATGIGILGSFILSAVKKAGTK